MHLMMAWPPRLESGACWREKTFVSSTKKFVRNSNKFLPLCSNFKISIFPSVITQKNLSRWFIRVFDKFDSFQRSKKLHKPTLLKIPLPSPPCGRGRGKRRDTDTVYKFHQRQWWNVFAKLLTNFFKLLFDDLKLSDVLQASCQSTLSLIISTCKINK